ncbi:MAG: archaetidylserine decarboxylase [Gammaproteobacteria bacterium]|nr:archaetidylserine decarboxylase [Gammaproteobacteria bacterium]
MRFAIIIQYITPQHLISRLIGKLASSHLPWLKNLFIKIFLQKYPVNMQEAIEPNPFNYKTFNDFFTRALKEEARPIAHIKNSYISPVDGTILQFGNIEEELIKAKGFAFTANTLLGDKAIAEKFRNGNFLVIYLAPHNYHRIHLPIYGKLENMFYVPGKLFSVRPEHIDTIENIFARNERVVNIFSTSAGTMAVVLVGAMIVGSIETTWHGVVTPNSSSQIASWDYTKQYYTFDQGTEIGKFKLGSTVILLFTKDTITWSDKIKINQPIKMGEIIGSEI